MPNQLQDEMRQIWCHPFPSTKWLTNESQWETTFCLCLRFIIIIIACFFVHCLVHVIHSHPPRLICYKPRFNSHNRFRALFPLFFHRLFGALRILFSRFRCLLKSPSIFIWWIFIAVLDNRRHNPQIHSQCAMERNERDNENNNNNRCSFRRDRRPTLWRIVAQNKMYAMKTN